MGCWRASRVSGALARTLVWLLFAACSSADTTLHRPSGSPPSAAQDGRDPAGELDASMPMSDAARPPLDDEGSCGLVSDAPDTDSCPTGCVEHCNGLDDDCDGRVDEGQAQTACAADHAASVCTRGQCVIAECHDDYRDCDSDPMTGCETAPDDPEHCGRCNQPCRIPHAMTSCDEGECIALGCLPGYEDCDDDLDNGCETAIDTLAHCGNCTTSCEDLSAVAEAICDVGQCAIDECAAGFVDCDGVAENGCEHDETARGPCLPEPDCVKQTVEGHDYYFCPSPTTHADARVKCQSQARSDLASIGSEEENDFLAGLVLAGAVPAAWIGARDAAIEGLWRWDATGVPFFEGDSSGSAQLGQYAAFADGEPSAATDAHDCASLDDSGAWADADCAIALPYVCEAPLDQCEDDDQKLEPGQCGCGNPDTDADLDGFAVCNDACDTDPSKLAPGACGCGMSDEDGDGDGVADCDDGCPLDPTQQGECLGYAPSNFDASGIDWSTQPSVTLDCGTTTIDSTDPDGAGALVATITGCGSLPTPIAQTQSGGGSVVLLALRGLNVASGSTLRLIGNRPIVLAVDGNATIDGVIDASANGTTAGAGGNVGCGTSAGGNGSGDTARFDGASGGGGGGFQTAGGRGGTADTDGSNTSGGIAGVVRASTLMPLVGGCGGGRAGDCSTNGGAGGGAVQIAASGTLTVNGTIRANGGQGATPCGSNDEGGGTGGGSGGAILLEAASLDTGSGTLQVNGGQGGRNGSYAGIYNCGNSNGGSGSTSASNAGGNGANCQGGSPGGGGGYGRIVTLDR